MKGHMERTTIRLPTQMTRRLERQVNRGEYPNRSEAIRAYIRDGLEADESAEDGKTKPLNPAGSGSPSLDG